MTIPRWTPSVEISPEEEDILKLAKHYQKLFGFLRRHRRDLFDDKFQAELETMYRDTGAGAPPKAPALMCMVLLLQAYVKASDAATVVLSRSDIRWKLVLGSLDSRKPLFSQGCLQQFRERLIAHDMDRRLLQRTAELAKKFGGFDWRKVPKKLYIAMDSRPLVGAGRVEDTFNLLGHAARKLLECASKHTGESRATICSKANCSLFLASSVKAGLDIDWSDVEQKADALNRLVAQMYSLVDWVDENIDERSRDNRTQYYADALAEFVEQDLERVSNDNESDADCFKIRDEVAKDRRISVEDPDMRHGRKSKSKAFNGYKEHVAVELSTKLILACAVTPANAPDSMAAVPLTGEIQDQELEIGELHVDLGYIDSPAIDEIEKNGGKVLCKPRPIAYNKTGLFTKADFDINVRDKTITCPAGQVKKFKFGKKVEFEPSTCKKCTIREQCSPLNSRRGRYVSISENEARQKRLRKQKASTKGRQRLRERVAVEHSLAHTSSRKGPRARYRGIRKNTYDLRRTSALQNLETIQRNAAA